MTIRVPFEIKTQRPPVRELAEIRGKEIAYVKTLTGKDVVSARLQGFSNQSEDAGIRIESTRSGVGMHIVSDRPLSSENLWSIRTVVAMEPFTAVEIEPGKRFSWKSVYTFYTLSKKP